MSLEISQYPNAAEALKKEFLGRETLSTPIVDANYLESLCQNDLELEMLLQSMLEACDNYTQTVCALHEFLLKAGTESDTEEYQRQYRELDAAQRFAHNATIDAIKILARNLGMRGKDSSWIQKFHDSRAAFGKFAMQTSLAKLLKNQGGLEKL